MASKVGVWVLQRTREQPTPAAGMAERIVSPRRRERKRRGEQQRHWELGALAPFRGGWGAGFIRGWGGGTAQREYRGVEVEEGNPGSSQCLPQNQGFRVSPRCSFAAAVTFAPRKTPAPPLPASILHVPLSPCCKPASHLLLFPLATLHFFAPSSALLFRPKSLV